MLFGDTVSETKRFNLQICAEQPGLLSARDGFALYASGDFTAMEQADIVVVPYWGEVNQRPPQALIASLIRARDNGAEIVVHMGIDTVALEGKGFKRLVEEGAQVKAGEPILEMDLAFLNANARSMISPVVCSNSDDYSALVIQATGNVVAGQTPLFEIKGK
ncbi:hypothetical protein UA44_08145 [Klebsiella aerogenes]|nr:hypothetical protein UA44_08145 [Klebsiella aerogenes]